MTLLPRYTVSLFVVAVIACNSSTVQAEVCQFGDKMPDKARRVVANFAGGFLETPKNIINTTNNNNIFYGLTGGLAKGLINETGRIMVSLFDLLTLPFPTQSITYPVRVWDDFSVDTRYGDLFTLDKSCDPVTIPESASSANTKSTPVTVPPRAIPNNLGANPKTQTNEKIDTLFKKEMMK
jgi:putative exosortase-associated protein (TIGR04073 family)